MLRLRGNNYGVATIYILYNTVTGIFIIPSFNKQFLKNAWLSLYNFYKLSQRNTNN